MDGIPPKTSYDHRPGKWIVEDQWPSKKINTFKYYLASKGKLSSKAEDTSISSLGIVNSTQVCGLSSGEYCAIWLGPEWPGDQRFDDGLSLCFDTEALNRRILLAPIINLEVKLINPLDKLRAAL